MLEYVVTRYVSIPMDRLGDVRRYVNRNHGYADGVVPLDEEAPEDLKEAHWHLNTTLMLRITMGVDSRGQQCLVSVEVSR